MMIARAPVPPPRTQAADPIWSLQILRLLAASMVLISHLNHEALQRPALARGFTPFAPFWWASGVDVFFVISGFIMYHISAGQFARPGAARQFVERRLVRLVPPYWLFTVVALVTLAILPGQMAHNHASWGQVLGSFLFWPVLAPNGRPEPVLILGWTLEFEMMFYTIFAVGLRFSRAIGLAVITGALVGLVVLSLAQPLPMPVGYWANPIVLEFLFGIGLAMAFRAEMRLRPWAGAILALIGIGLLMWVKAQGWPGVAWVWRPAWAGLPALLICAGVVLVPARPRPGALMRPLVLLGDASYAMYLSHPFVLSVVAMVFERRGNPGAWAYIVVGFFACTAAAVGVHLGFERPLHLWLTSRIAAVRAQRRVSKITVIAG